MKEKRIEVAAAGGLANRMRAIASGVALGSAAGCRCIVIWDNNVDLRADFNDLFVMNDMPVDITPVRSRTERLLYSLPRKKNLYLPALLQSGKYSHRIYDGINCEWYGEHPDALLRDVKCADGSVLIYSGQQFYPFPDELLRSLFRFSHEVHVRAGEIAGSELNFDFGIHVRRTDNVDSIENSPIDVFKDKIDSLVSMDPEARIFVASDSQEVKQILSEKYPLNVFYNEVAADRKSRNGMIDAAAEMLILSRTDAIFGSYWSSYSEMAALLGNTPLTICRK